MPERPVSSPLHHLDTSDSDSIYLAHLLFDLIQSDTHLLGTNHSNTIFETLHWNLKKIFRDGDEIVEDINDKYLMIGYERINEDYDAVPFSSAFHLIDSKDAFQFFIDKDWEDWF